MSRAAEKGRGGERAAARYLQARGLRILFRGYRCRFGEIDLVCRDGSTLVLVEVRRRAAGAIVSAAASVGAAKQRRLTATARHLLMTHPQFAEMSMRFDVVAITDHGNELQIDWIRQAF